MSRARPVVGPDGTVHWFNVTAPATVKHLELLADIKRIDLDDILEDTGATNGEPNLSQKQVLQKIHEAENLVPVGVLEHRRELRAKARIQEPCRICSGQGWECEGRITRHHFVPRWLMRELDKYQRYAARSKCTVPICVGRHRDLHYRGEEAKGKSIVPYLNTEERELVEKMLLELKAERPVIFDLILGGTEENYEYQLLRDFVTGEFRKAPEKVKTSGEKVMRGKPFTAHQQRVVEIAQAQA